jgi:hypothetical protein
MSAAVYLRQRDAAWMLTDAAVYFADGVIHSFEDKTEIIDEAHCALTMLGPYDWGPAMAEAIRDHFRSYDEVRDGIEPVARRVFANLADEIRWKTKTCELWIVGWSQAQGRPEAFTLTMCDDAEWEIWKQRAPGIEEERAPFVPDVQVVAINANPAPTAQQFFEARFPTCDPEQYVPERDMLHMLEIQRRTRLEHQQWPWLVGGHATLTRVDHLGVTQRVIHTWDEDRVGERIQPKPITNWAGWRAALVAGRPLSRLKLDQIARKQAKALRRVAG